tara:strand:- start:128 stop:1681 length:1554 start_codon:yes stop_codon:yes gene_type:complete
MTSLQHLQNFRQQLYELFPSRRDAIFELIDSISSYANNCKSIVELSQALCFTREYTSITDAISDGLNKYDFSGVTKLIFKHCCVKTSHKYHLFGTDVTACPRPHAKKLDYRSIVHAPTYTPGQKPIALGHQYSVASWLPSNKDDRDKHWIVPLAGDRVPTSQKPSEFGMTQLTKLIVDLDLQNELVVSVSDSAYGSENCRTQAKTISNLVHIYRLPGHINLYCKLGERKNNQKKYGDTMSLKKNERHNDPDDTDTTTYKSCKGRLYHVSISRWHDMMVRGTRTFKAYEHPFDLLKVEIRPMLDDGSYGDVIGKPMWLVAYGERRREISTLDIYNNYAQRFDLEHYFRFGKNNMLLTKYQTPSVENEEVFFMLCLIAYAQMYLARNDAELVLTKWEQYGYVHNQCGTDTLSPTKVQRSFQSVLEKTSTPAKAAKKRGINAGRKAGESACSRENIAIIFKTQPSKSKPCVKLSGFEKKDRISNLQSLVEAVKSLPKVLKRMGFTVAEFTEVLKNASASP